MSSSSSSSKRFKHKKPWFKQVKKGGKLITHPHPHPHLEIPKQLVLDLPRKEPNNATFKCLSKHVIESEQHIDLNVHSIGYDRVFDFHNPIPICVGPAIQVISISINHSNPSHLHILGEISVTDYKKKKYIFYHRKSTQLQRIEPCGRNELILSCVPVAPVMGGPISFNILRDDGIPIFDGIYDLNEAVQNSEKKTYTLEGLGELGYQFKMVFTRNPFAILARVDMYLEAPPATNEESFKIHGRITANNIICFRASEECNIYVKYGVATKMRMVTHIIVVSIDSLLIVDSFLYNGSLVISEDRYRIEPAKGTMVWPRTWRLKCKNESYVFSMDVCWILHRDFFPYPDIQMLNDLYFPMLIGHHKLDPNALVEVFSVSLSSCNSTAPFHLDLCGKIVVLDGGKNFYIFARDKDLPDKWSSSNNEEEFRTLSVAWPNDRWVFEKGFNMYLELKDVEHNLICRGQLSWSHGNDRRYNSRFCDVIKGEKGCLGAVHYSVFSNGNRAKVSIECHNFGPKFLVYGTVYAQYDNYDYPSVYEVQCYRSVLFTNSKECPRLVKKYFNLPLLKSHVTAPSDCKELIVSVDLWIRPCSTFDEYERFQFSSAERKFCDVGIRRVVVQVEYIPSEFVDPPVRSKPDLLQESLSEPLNLFDLDGF